MCLISKLAPSSLSTTQPRGVEASAPREDVLVYKQSPSVVRLSTNSENVRKEQRGDGFTLEGAIHGYQMQDCGDRSTARPFEVEATPPGKTYLFINRPQVSSSCLTHACEA
jgi:hypothetical protein